MSQIEKKESENVRLKDFINGSESPQLILGIAAAVGTPLDFFTHLLQQELEDRAYALTVSHLSRYTKLFELPTQYPAADADEYQRISSLMDRGNQARELSGREDILAMCAIGEIIQSRTAVSDRLIGQAFALRQLKHPEEVHFLRQVYGDGFHLLGLYYPRDEREYHLHRGRGIPKDKVAELIERDEYEPSDWGQHLRKTFHLSDVFLDLGQSDDGVREELGRWLDLICGLGIYTPTIDEFGMFNAAANSLRSASLSRQVGAAILSERGELISVGSNEVPCYGGGQYWEGDSNDSRDNKRGNDSNHEMELFILKEVLSKVDPQWEDLSQVDQDERVGQARERLRDARIMNLTEFGRAVHAEMEALLAAVRLGISVSGSVLYSTTFPCHNCTKHIIGAGIREVVYIEPYPKSLGPELHQDAVSIEEETGDKVLFRPFVGVSPRRYFDLFSMREADGRKIPRKDDLGQVIENSNIFRLTMPYTSCFERERVAVRELEQITKEEQ